MTLEELKELVSRNRGIIKDCQRRIRVLEQQEAKWGLNTPTNILVEKEEAREKIQECEQEIEYQKQAYVVVLEDVIKSLRLVLSVLDDKIAFLMFYNQAKIAVEMTKLYVYGTTPFSFASANPSFHKMIKAYNPFDEKSISTAISNEANSRIASIEEAIREVQDL